VLLVRSQDVHSPGTWWWELPGGGLEPGEDAIEALLRELREETGLLDIEVGAARWTWRAVWRFSDRVVDQSDTVHLCRQRSLLAQAPAPLADEGVLGHVWLSLEEVRGHHDAGTPMVPHQLPDLVATAVRERTGVAARAEPPEVVDIGTGELPPVTNRPSAGRPAQPRWPGST